MVSAGVLGALLVMTCVLLHYEVLKALHVTMPRAGWLPKRARVLVGLLGAMLSHFLHIALFAGAYYVLRDKFGLGSFGGQFDDVYSSFLYFSTETYTTLGLGDIYPLGSLRLVLGLETLTGLLMISWTASFSYLEMRENW